MQKKESVLRVIKETVRKHGVLSAALLGVVCGAVIFALLPPLVLAQLIDLLTKKHTLWMEGILLYFGLLALTGLLESARESLLTVFGQKITHALRSSLMEKFGRLSANELNRQEPGALVSRFVGDVDTVENLFTSGIISMFADACKILSILAVIWVTNRGLTIVLIILLPVLYPLCSEKHADLPDCQSPCSQPCFGSRSGDAAQHPYHPLSAERDVYGAAVCALY